MAAWLSQNFLLNISIALFYLQFLYFSIEFEMRVGLKNDWNFSLNYFGIQMQAWLARSRCALFKRTSRSYIFLTKKLVYVNFAHIFLHNILKMNGNIKYATVLFCQNVDRILQILYCPTILSSRSFLWVLFAFASAIDFRERWF